MTQGGIAGAALLADVVGGLLVAEEGADEVELLDGLDELELVDPGVPLVEVVDDRPVPRVRFPDPQPASTRETTQQTTIDDALTRVGVLRPSKKDRMTSFWQIGT